MKTILLPIIAAALMAASFNTKAEDIAPVHGSIKAYEAKHKGSHISRHIGVSAAKMKAKVNCKKVYAMHLAGNKMQLSQCTRFSSFQSVALAKRAINKVLKDNASGLEGWMRSENNVISLAGKPLPVKYLGKVAYAKTFNTVIKKDKFFSVALMPTQLICVVLAKRNAGSTAIVLTAYPVMTRHDCKSGGQ